MNRKGIILAGGSGTRLYPITQVTSKQLLPIYDKPMIYYPLSILMRANIKEILIISTPRDLPLYKELLEDGSQWGIKIDYLVQHKPEGLAQAFIIAEDFIDNQPSCLILGDNLFFGQELDQILKEANNDENATIFLSHVNDPERYGVATFDNERKVTSIEEKPSNPKSNYAVTGLYFYDKNAVSYAKTLSPSKRGELEITDLNQIYLNKQKLSSKIMGQGFAWLDTGTPQSLLEAQQFVHIIEHRTGLKIACLEEIAFAKNWINKEHLKNQLKKFNNSNYGDYLRKLIEQSN